MSRPTTAHTRIDFEKSGKQNGFIDIPHSPHHDAWGATRVPISVIANGTGPTVVLMGGNHGDEYEGPIALGELIRDLDMGAVQGRLIFLPALNSHAVAAGRRVSPVDGLNLNRTFPGDPLGTIGQQITAFVSDYIYPLGDALIDLHSGGSSLDILPSAVIEPAPTAEHWQRNAAAALAFGAPMTVVIDNLGDPRTSTATSVRMGMTTMGTEMAGGGRVSLDALDICRRGVRNVLQHLGVIEPVASTAPTVKSGLFKIPGPDGFVYATGPGVFEPAHDLGIKVSAGQLAGRIHNLTDPSRPPELLHFLVDGIVYGRRQPGRVEQGNCCLTLAVAYEGAIS